MRIFESGTVVSSIDVYPGYRFVIYRENDSIIYYVNGDEERYIATDSTKTLGLEVAFSQGRSLF
jgi:hypothetical protein